MRIDENGESHTLEQDIVETWQKHGLKVTEERFINNTWEIKAKPITNKEAQK